MIRIMNIKKLASALGHIIKEPREISIITKVNTQTAITLPICILTGGKTILN
jgi:hypothetical protein